MLLFNLSQFGEHTRLINTCIMIARLLDGSVCSLIRNLSYLRLIDYLEYHSMGHLIEQFFKNNQCDWASVFKNNEASL